MLAKLVIKKSAGKISFSFQFVLILFAALSLSACGGGGGGGGGGGTTGDSVPVVPPGSGSLSNPSILNIETLYSGSVNAGSTIYYRFTTGSRSLRYLVDLQNLSDYVSWTLYSDSAYSSYVSSCSQSLDTSDCKTSNALNSNTIYYLKLQNLSPTNASYTIRLDRVVSSEGSISAPVQLVIGSVFEGTLGPKLYSSTVHSYYKFTTGLSDSTYTISLTGASTDVRWKLYSGGWNNGVRDCDDIWSAGDESCATVSLLANTEYFLSIETQGPKSTFVNINISTGGTHVNSFNDDGSVPTPAVIALEQTQTGSISPNGMSYYKFTTANETASHYVQLKHVSAALYIQLYNDSNFTNQVDGVSFYAASTSFLDIGWRTILLDPNSTYYLKLENIATREDQFQIAIYQDAIQDPNNEGTMLSPVVLTPGVLHSGTVGTLSSSKYEYTLPEAKPYQLSLTNGQTDLYWVDKYDFNSLSSHTLCSTTFGPGDEVCVIYRVDAGTKLYMYVGNEDSSSPSTYDLLLTVIEGEGEGTQATPVSIVPGTPFASSLAANGYSYYQFTTGAEPVKHRISVTGASTDTKWTLTKVGDLNKINDCSTFDGVPIDMICETDMLVANATYRLYVANKEAMRTDITVTVDTGTVIKNVTLDVALISQSYDGYSDNNGYYKFTTDATNTSYTLQLTGSVNPVSIFVYPDDTYASYTTLCSTSEPASQNISCTLNGLAINTMYYLRTYVSKNSGVSDNFDISVLADNYTETGIVLTPSADYLGKVASNGASDYQFTTAGGGPRVHDISFTGVSESYVKLYDDSLLTNQIDICYAASGTVACSTSGTLSAGTTYYVVIDEIGGFSGKFTLNITSQ